MATTTEEWIDVHSPYNGEVVGQRREVRRR